MSGREIKEVSLKAILGGLAFGALFGAANAYLGLRVGLTVSTSIPIAVLSVALFRSLSALGGKPGTILEANLSQTIGSASSSLAAGTIFTIPALFLWGLRPSLLQVGTLALLGGILGICAMVPLRRLLIVESHDELPYPEGTACAEVLKASDRGASASRWIFIGLAFGIAIKLLIGALKILPSEIGFDVPGMDKAHLALEVAPALLGVGYILGYRGGSIMVSGSLLSAVVLIPLISHIGAGLQTPLFPEAERTVAEMSAGQIWSRYVRYIGAGAVAAGGILSVLRTLPTMYASLAAIVRGVRERAGELAARTVERTDRDMSGSIVIGGFAVVILILALVPGLFVGDMNLGARSVAAVGVAVFGMLFVAVSSRIVGLIGVSSNPTSGMAIVALLGTSAIFLGLGWDSVAARATVLTVGTVVCVAASKAGDISQDLKTGYLVGATPARQQLGQLLGASVSAWVVALTVLGLGMAYGFGGKELPAPQATLMRTVIEGVLARSLPWEYVLSGAAFSLTGALAGLPALPFAVGIYLPLATMSPIYFGGLLRRMVDARRGGVKSETDPGVLCASGLIAGEGLAGLGVAGLAYSQGRTFLERPILIGGGPGELVAIAMVLAALGLLWLSACESKSADANRA